MLARCEGSPQRLSTCTHHSCLTCESEIHVVATDERISLAALTERCHVSREAAQVSCVIPVALGYKMPPCDADSCTACRVADVMTESPVVVRQTTDMTSAARLLLDTKVLHTATACRSLHLPW